MFYLNPQYLLYMAPAILLMLAAQWYVKSTYNKWGRVSTRNGISGAEAAQRLIRASGLGEIPVHQIPGNLTDHYDPRKKELSLSSGVYQGSSIASVAIAAHELGHAQQDQEGYFPLRLRSMLVPAVNIGSTLGWILIMAGLVLNVIGIAWLGVFAFSGGAIFALATLPVELNASSRAKSLLKTSGIILSGEEEHGVNQVLNAAALTYIASLFTAVMQLLYWISIVSGGRRRR
ncbi:MAG: zinc metallopeptidase [Anaerolineales bacterium]|nr:zinc metallopeptidase [Anaerolineales bacterium]TFG47340.1 MAG: zinc metallopeptidase [Anaerolineales bacterium]